MRHRWPGFHIGIRCFWLVTLATGALVGLGLPRAFANPLPAQASPVLRPAHAPMTAVAFAALLAKLQRLSFGDEQLELARAAVHRGHYFTCTQATQLMRASAFADDQVKIAATLYPRLVDLENSGQLLSTLARESDRQKLRSLVGP